MKLTAERQLFLIVVLLLAAALAFMVSRKGFSASVRQPHSVVFAVDALEMPFADDDTFILRNNDGRYTLFYDTSARQAAWVAYRLTGNEVRFKGAKRKNRFKIDPQIVVKGWPMATDGDYSRSGYDRGHLLPSADRDDTQNENDATFLLSNIAPQLPELNRGVWNRLEQAVRDAAERYDTVYVATGGICGKNPKRIGSGQVAVPEQFFKALLVKSGERVFAIGFAIPNGGVIGSDYMSYAVSVDSLEKLSGFDFFYNLPDDIEDAIEAECDYSLWRQ